MRVVTATEMREIDRMAIEEYSIPGIVLMENAGKQVVDAVIEQLGGCVKAKVVTIFVGKGNNGGDGLVVARHLLNMGADVRVLMISDPEGLLGDAKTNLNIWRSMGQKVYPVHLPNGINMVKVSLMSTDIIVDAMYGTGFRGTVNEKIGRIIELINNSGLPVVSVDIPSGLETDTGAVNGPCIQANITVTFGLPKIGCVLESGSSVVGHLKVVDISIPKPLLADAGAKAKAHLVDKNMIQKWLPQRSAAAHKGNFGRVLILAGSVGMGGAAVLTATACLRSGAGLVTIAIPEQLHNVVACQIPEAMTLPVAQSDTALDLSALEVLAKALKDYDIFVVGPGLSRHEGTTNLIHKLLPQVKIPTVVDADGLNALAEDIKTLENVNAPLVLTPHPGEMARLADVSVKEVQNNRVTIVRQCAELWGCTVLLKGVRTLVADNKGTLYINPTGNPGMATAGSGDVLSGIIAGLMAQGVENTPGAAMGAYLHGLAGDRAIDQTGIHGLIAGDIIKYLPGAIKEMATI